MRASPALRGAFEEPRFVDDGALMAAAHDFSARIPRDHLEDVETPVAASIGGLRLYPCAHGVPVDQSPRDIFSRDGNLWHLSHEGGNLEDPWDAPRKQMFKLTVDPEDAPDEPEVVTLDGKRQGPVGMVETLNRVAGAHGVGRLDLVENRLVGIKSRGVYETPAGTVLHHAHRELASGALRLEQVSGGELEQGDAPGGREHCGKIVAGDRLQRAGGVRVGDRIAKLEGRARLHHCSERRSFSSRMRRVISSRGFCR